MVAPLCDSPESTESQGILQIQELSGQAVSSEYAQKYYRPNALIPEGKTSHDPEFSIAKAFTSLTIAELG
jgi:hypothetical protein